MTPAESERQFDDLLRRKFAGDEVQPSAALWPAVSATLPAAPPARPWRPVGGAALLGILLGVLVGWWAGSLSAEKGRFQRPIAIGNDMKAIGNDMMAIGNDMKAIKDETKPIGTRMKSIGDDMKTIGTRMRAVGTGMKHVGTETKAVRSTMSGAAPQLPLPLVAAATVLPALTHAAAPVPVRLTLWEVALAQDSSIRQEAAATIAPGTAGESRVTALVAQQQLTLASLQHQLDSLKQALPAEPAAPPVLTSAPVPAKDSATKSAATLPARWSVAVLAETTTPWGVLPTPAPDLRETAGAAIGRGVQLEHRLQNDRWLVRGGLSDVRMTSQFRGVATLTGEREVRDTTRVLQIDTATRTTTVRLVRLDSVLHFNPRINGAGQIIGYDSVWAQRNDTLTQVVTTRDTVHRFTQTVQARRESYSERYAQHLQPAYRFWSLPLAMQFDIVRRGRWRAGVGVGTTLLFFRGADVPVLTADGYALRRVGARSGPFRPVSVALTTAVEVRYALSDRLSVLAGAGGRGWVQSPVRGESRPRLQPTGQVGISWGLGGR